MKTKRVCITLPIKLLEALDEKKHTQDGEITRSAMIREAINQYLKKS